MTGCEEDVETCCYICSVGDNSSDCYGCSCWCYYIAEIDVVDGVAEAARLTPGGPIWKRES